MSGLNYDAITRIPLLTGTLLAPLAFAVCGSMGQPAPAPISQGQVYVYICPDDFRFSVQLMGDTALVTLPDRELRLPQVIAASGTRYAAGGVVFWSEGLKAMLETPESSHEGCQGQPVSSPWEVSRLLGFEFRGVGQEPGWTIEIDTGQMIRLVLDYGEKRYYLPAPEPVRRPNGDLFYDIRTEAVSATVLIAEKTCQDAMSGEESTHTVTVTIDGKEYRGCGRILSTGELTGTRWSLVEIGGRAATAGADKVPPFLRLLKGEDRVVGNTGCNGISGHYEVTGDQLDFDMLVTTLRACVDPGIARQEQSFTEALNATDHFAIRGDTLTLYQESKPLARLAAWYLR